MIKLIIFDLWETLIQATIDWTNLKALAREKNLDWDEFMEKYEISSQKKVFESKEELKKSFFSNFPEMDIEWLEKVFYQFFDNRFDKIIYFEEVPAVLNNLKENYKLALLTNTESNYFKEIKSKLHFDKYFDDLFLSFELGAIKPDSKVFEIILKKFNVSPKEIIMVGDSMRSDIGGARQLGINTCWINRDKDKNKFDFSADFEIHSMNELIDILKKFDK